MNTKPKKISRYHLIVFAGMLIMALLMPEGASFFGVKVIILAMGITAGMYLAMILGLYFGTFELESRSESMEEPTLTPDQIRNWRTVLVTVLGPYALIMPDEDIIKYWKTMQAALKKHEPKVP